MTDRRVLSPTSPLAFSCPPGVHRATYERLIWQDKRRIAKLDELPRRRLWPRTRLVYQRPFENQMIQILRVSAAHGRPLGRGTSTVSQPHAERTKGSS
jgi:hypothetical protein